MNTYREKKTTTHTDTPHGGRPRPEILPSPAVWVRLHRGGYGMYLVSCRESLQAECDVFLFNKII